MTLDSYIQSLRGKSIAVIGLGVSNRPLLRLLLDAGYTVSVRDKRTREAFGEDEAAALEAAGCRLVLGDGYLAGITEDVIFRTPGLHPFTPELAAAKARGALLTSEMEAFFTVCPCRIIAVTGSDGKTTTTTIISELLKAQGHRVFLGGNIGTPLLDKAPEMTSTDWAVLELSSFQLHSMNCRPDIAVVTNVSPNHLDIHPSYEDYQTAKKQIFLSQGCAGVTVLNADNAITRAFAKDCPGKVRFFSRETAPENGVFLREGVIYRSHNGEKTKLMDAESILLPGLHNVENYMAAFAGKDYVIRPPIPLEIGAMERDPAQLRRVYDTGRAVAESFRGVAHRLEMIRTLHGVTYCNDSIASSPTRTIAGLHALRQKPILIAGGYDKHIPFDKLGDEICRHVKALFLTGFTAEKIYDAVTKSPLYDPKALPIRKIDDFREAVLVAAASAEEGDLVLLSPACASFDHFKNFVERGETFRSIVNELK